MLRVGGGAAIAAGQNFAVAHEAGNHHFCGVGDRRRQQFSGVALGLGAIGEVLAHA